MKLPKPMVFRQTAAPIRWMGAVSLSKQGMAMQESEFCLYGTKALGRVSPSADGEIRENLVFSGDMCLGKNTAQAANVRAQRVRCGGLYPLSKMLAFLRSVSTLSTR